MAQKGRQLLSLLLVSCLFVGLLMVWLNRLAIYDWWRLRNYQPNSQVVNLTTADTMTGYATHMFYVNRPVIADKAVFNQNCPNDGGEQTIVLGCYHSNETGIYLYSVSDPKLSGVEQVTAAHETLHAIYERLSSKDKTYVNGLLEDFYKHDLKDKRVLDTIESYKKTEPNDVVNEMHSVFGTEVSKLTPALETYYKKYFSNRQKVVAYAQQYQQTFVNNQAQADRDLSQIKTIEQQLSTMKTQIDSQETQLIAENQQLEAERPKVTNQTAADFRNQVNQYNAQVQTYRTLINQYNALIDRHNNLVNQYQAITTETNQLIKELDSRSSTISSQ